MACKTLFIGVGSWGDEHEKRARMAPVFVVFDRAVVTLALQRCDVFKPPACRTNGARSAG